MGYARNHSGDTYHMKNNTIGEIHITQDVKWITGNSPRENKYTEEANDKEDIIVEETKEPEHEIIFEPANEQLDKGPLFEKLKMTPINCSCLTREVRMLKMYNNSGQLDEEVHFCYNTEEINKKNNKVELENFQDTWWHPDPEKHKNGKKQSD